MFERFKSDIRASNFLQSVDRIMFREPVSVGTAMISRIFLDTSAGYEVVELDIKPSDDNDRSRFVWGVQAGLLKPGDRVEVLIRKPAGVFGMHVDFGLGQPYWLIAIRPYDSNNLGNSSGVGMELRRIFTVNIKTRRLNHSFYDKYLLQR